MFLHCEKPPFDTTIKIVCLQKIKKKQSVYASFSLSLVWKQYVHALIYQSADWICFIHEMSEQLLVMLTKCTHVYDDAQRTIKHKRFRQRVFVRCKKTDRK